jgi:hypothetical protein
MLKLYVCIFVYSLIPLLLFAICKENFPNEIPTHYTNGIPDKFNDIEYYLKIVVSFSILGFVFQFFILNYFKNKLIHRYLLPYALICGSLFVIPISLDVISQYFRLNASIVDAAIFLIIALHIFLFINKKKYLLIE